MNFLTAVGKNIMDNMPAKLEHMQGGSRYPKRKVLLTGATGKLGRPMLEALIAEGYVVKVATPDEPLGHSSVEWCRANFLYACDYRELVRGCEAVIHLAAELTDVAKMDQINRGATRSIVLASEHARVKLFVYTSSVCVYGMPRETVITEETPTISTDIQTDSNFVTAPHLMEYARTKLLGEYEIKHYGDRAKYIVLRPSNIADDDNIVGPLAWPLAVKIWRANRYTHQIHIDDVVAGILFMLNKHLNAENHTPGILTYNLSNDDEESNKFSDLFVETARRNGRLSLIGLGARIPGWLDWQKDRIKYRRLSIGYPSGMVKYVPDKILSTGFMHPLGIMRARTRVLDKFFPR
jgi:nucleoside-diphosphate-sugar epimerase